MGRQNCWEFMNCGRGIDGENVDTLGMCHVALEASADGLNGGVNGGRICWAFIEGDNSDCGICPELRGGDSCFDCEFRQKVAKEEGLLNLNRALDEFLKKSPISD